MLLYPVWYRRHGLRRVSQLVNPVLSALPELSLPRSSIVHYLPVDDVQIGPASDEWLIRDPSRLTYVDHVTVLKGDKGPPRPTHQPPMKFVRDYHRKNRRLKLLRNAVGVLQNPKTLLVENYAILNQLSRYSANFFSAYYKWYNVRVTLWDQINTLAQTNAHQHYIQCALPTLLPSLSSLRRAESKMDRGSLERFRTPDTLNLLDLWSWLGEHRAETPMGRLAPEALDRVNLVWVHDGRWFVVNLGLLDSWREGGVQAEGAPAGLPTLTVQKYLLRGLMRLSEVSTVAGDAVVVQSPEGDEVPVVPVVVESPEDTGETATVHNTLSALKDEAQMMFKEDLATGEHHEAESDLDLTAELDALNEVLATKQAATTAAPAVAEVAVDQGYATGVLAKANAMADQGALSGAEYRRFLALAETYKTLPNPYGKGTLAEHAEIAPELLVMEAPQRLPDQPGVLDKSMLQSSMLEFDSRYVKDVLSRDIVNSVLSVQNAGVAVTGHSMEVVEDAMNRYEAHTVKLTPVSGQSSTVRFRVPVINPDGTYLANGVQYRLRKQRGD